jgi:hypothetical protein
VVLDCRRPLHTAATFETAVSAAASVLDTAAVTGAAFRLATTAGVDTGIGTDAVHLESSLVELAVASTRQASVNRSLHTAMDRHDTGGMLVMVTTTRCGERDIDAMLSARRPAGLVLVLVGEGPTNVAGGQWLRIVRMAAGGSVRAAWAASLGVAGSKQYFEGAAARAAKLEAAR